jgi:hypothetical protein
VRLPDGQGGPGALRDERTRSFSAIAANKCKTKGMKCHYTKELNLETLVWTRGRKMPLSDLKDRMMCPRCGGRRISIIFDPKPTVRAQAV